MILDPENDWLPSHGVLEHRLGASFPLVDGVGEAPMPFLRPFTLAHHFTRGGYPASLHAGSALRARQWRERWLRVGLPLLPLDQRGTIVEPAQFWPLLAELNGLELGKLQRALRLDGATLARAVALAEQRGLEYFHQAERRRRMLQINTGKLYARGVGRTNRLRGVYSPMCACHRTGRS